MSKLGETLLVIAVVAAVSVYVASHVTCFDFAPFSFKGCVFK